MLAALICREFKWTWQEYMDQPQPFLDTIMEMLNAEGMEGERRQKQQQAKRPH